jgi:antitoxin (DNA-binding transcriptional repressor) of toxin-antitoxin stability system
MARTVDVIEAQAHFSRLLRDVEKGEEVILARAGIAVARLTPIDRPRRQLGIARGQIWISPDFDAPMPADWLDEWEQ